jgi:NAD(P)H-dependent FMN reductase
MRLLAISGSLRVRSSNLSILKGAAQMVPEGVNVLFYEGLGLLPHFNPDLDHEKPPIAVTAFRVLLKESDGVLISSPEYAHAVPGSLKNALDWVVSSGELVNKPVLLLNASAGGGERVQAQLTDILTVMTARVLPGVSLLAGTARKAFDEQGHLIDPEVARTLQAGLNSLLSVIENPRK